MPDAGPDCPICQTPRARDARWCHGCGFAYWEGDLNLYDWSAAPAAAPVEAGLSIEGGFMFGLGFFLAGGIFAFLGVVIGYLLITRAVFG